MINQMKQRFLLVSMGSFTLVMMILFITLNSFNYIQNVERTEAQAIGFFEMQLGMNQPVLPSNNRTTVINEPKPKIENNSFDFEALFGLDSGGDRRLKEMLNYFFVIFNTEGDIEQTTIGIAETINETEANEVATEIYQQNKQKGWSGYYRFIKQELSDGRTVVMYVDSYREIQSMVQFLGLSAAIFIIVLIVVYLLLRFLSDKAIMPLINNINRQKEFISNASHEIKTPLAVLSTNNDVMEMIGMKSEWTESNRNQIKRLNALIEQMLLLARFDEGKATIKPIPVNIAEIVAEEIDEMTMLAVENGSMIINQLPDIVMEKTDQESIKQLITSLIENAVKYHIGQDPIIIKWLADKRELWVENTCELMTEAEKEQLFERFYRRESARNREQGGSGMGLSIAKAVAQAANLSLDAELLSPTRIVFKVRFKSQERTSKKGNKFD